MSKPVTVKKRPNLILNIDNEDNNTLKSEKKDGMENSSKNKKDTNGDSNYNFLNGTQSIEL